MKSFFALVVAALLVSCGGSTSSSTQQLLTSKSWAEQSETTSVHTFADDGSYSLNAGDVHVNGKWKWVNSDEMYVEIAGITINGQAGNFDKSSNYYIRIVELTDNSLKTLERHEGDNWDSGFASEKQYVSQTL